MDMIKEYESDSPTSEENDDIFVPASNELDARSVRKVYLITNSQLHVDEELFPTRRSFLDAVLQSFNDSNVVQWCCSLEQHISAGVHYHFQKEIFTGELWYAFLRDSQQLLQHVEVCHEGRQTLYPELIDHPDLTNTGAPRTTMASIPVQSRSKKKASHNAGENTSDESDVGHNHTQVSTDPDADNNKAKRRKNRMTSYELSEIALAKNMSCLLLQDNRNSKAKLTSQSS